MADPITIARQLLRRLAGLLSDHDVAAWAARLLRELAAEGPVFGADQDSLADVLKRCSISGGALADDDLRWLLLKLASLRGPLPPFERRGRFLACRRLGKFLPRGSGIVSGCSSCGAEIVFPASRIPRLRDCDGALLCWRCAQTFPGRLVDFGAG